MKNFKITKNGKDLVNGLTKKEALNKLFLIVEDHSNGYIYDNDAEIIYNEVSGQIYAEKGDEYVETGDNVFEIEEDNDLR